MSQWTHKPLICLVFCTQLMDLSIIVYFSCEDSLLQKRSPYYKTTVDMVSFYALVSYHKYYNLSLIEADFSCTRSMPLTSRTASRQRSATSRRRRNDKRRRRNRDKRHSKTSSQPSNDHLPVLLEPCFNRPSLPCCLCQSSVYQITIAEILCNAFRGFHSRFTSILWAYGISFNLKPLECSLNFELAVL